MLFDFKIIDVNERLTSGTCLQDYLTENYSTLVEVFGEPTYSEPSGDGKVHTEWSLEFVVQEQGEEDTEVVLATIYDWKEPNADVARETLGYRWHIGGNSRDAVDVVTQRIQDYVNG